MVVQDINRFHSRSLTKSSLPFFCTMWDFSDDVRVAWKKNRNDFSFFLSTFFFLFTHVRWKLLDWCFVCFEDHELGKSIEVTMHYVQYSNISTHLCTCVYICVFLFILVLPKRSYVHLEKRMLFSGLNQKVTAIKTAFALEITLKSFDQRKLSNFSCCLLTVASFNQLLLFYRFVCTIQELPLSF